MEFSEVELEVLERYRDKCRLAGGPKAGYNMRRRTIELGVSGGDPGPALDSLVEKGWLAANEEGDRFVLTEDGAEGLEAAVAGTPGAAAPA